MPWLSLLSFILTFLLQKSKGKSTGAALVSAGLVGLATYALADPTNPSNLFGVGVDSGGVAAAGAPKVAAVGEIGSSAASSSVTDLLGKTVTTTGDVLKSWGGTGTAAVIGTTTLATSSSASKYLPWIIGGVVLFAALK